MSDEIIVTKTDVKGRITYANDVFLNISHLTERQALGAHHNIIRHPDMPACIFHLLWSKIQSREEVFAYVLNRAVNGDHYWVLAHVTPTIDDKGVVTGYHSNRRVPDRTVIADIITPLYQSLLEEESRAGKAQRIAASSAKLNDLLQTRNMDYDRFIFSLQA